MPACVLLEGYRVVVHDVQEGDGPVLEHACVSRPLPHVT